jgi:feruloyl-CoA synthase
VRYRPVALGELTPIVDRRADGVVALRAMQPLGPYPARFTERLVDWARAAPDRTLLAWRERGEFARLTYAEALGAVRSIGQALLDRGLSADRPAAILSGNDREHLLVALAAQHVGIPYVPISPAYSLVSRDFNLLKQVLALLTPGLVFVSDASLFDRALRAAVAPGVEVVARVASADGRRATPFETLAATRPTPDVDRAHAAIAPDAIAKILLTSGSTGTPKAVINTHRMLCSNQAMIAHVLPFLREEPPVLVDWLPWHHTFGGNHNIGIVVFHGGSLYIDEGRPMPGAFEESVRILREIAPTIYLNVPRGYEELVKAMRRDGVLRRNFFSRLRLMFYAAAALSQHILDELNDLAAETCGERLIMVTGLGATETAPMALCRPWDSDISTAIGLPVPGLEAKIVPAGGKLEVRVRGPNVTPGYWRQEALTRAAFDEEGFYCMGDAVRYVDPADAAKGFIFDGRIAEDFKLSTGSWVNVGMLRAAVISHLAPYVRDAVIAGHDRSEIGILAVPDLDACRALCRDLASDRPAAEVLAHEAVRQRIRRLLAEFAAGATGSTTRVARALLLEEGPSLDGQEITDKGSLNQRAVLKRRAALVDELYAEPPSRRVLLAC